MCFHSFGHSRCKAPKNSNTHNPMMIAYMIFRYNFQHQPIEKIWKIPWFITFWFTNLRNSWRIPFIRCNTLPISNGHQPGGPTTPTKVTPRSGILKSSRLTVGLLNWTFTWRILPRYIVNMMVLEITSSIDNMIFNFICPVRLGILNICGVSRLLQPSDWDASQKNPGAFLDC